MAREQGIEASRTDTVPPREAAQGTPTVESAGVEHLIGRLRDEGIAQGRSQAEGLITAAQHQAADIVATAQREAEALRVKATEEAAKLKADAAWTAGPVFGLLKVAPNLQFNDPKLSSVLIGDDAGLCKGAFLSGALPETTEKKSVRIFTTCKEDAKTMTVYYLAVPGRRAESISSRRSRSRHRTP